MSYYLHQVNSLNREIRTIKNGMELAGEHRQELLEVRRKLVSEKSTLTSDKSQIKEPEIGNDTARGTIASEFESEERDMLEQEHGKLPEQVQEMIDAIDSERDNLQSKISSGRLQVQFRNNRINHLRKLDRQAKANANKG
ncbi:YwqH-like family protein [Shouchella lonarensis]|uniref:Uncharacterized protein n=1 Tax=Shouchella lonarensis TaxID=1464122 RepID=A0A1G6GYJ0_9BACI|nr:DUF5082 family protein [Shouchella lonarensis]SDB86958.1 protein of unknown function [Shouchella lonarensis]